MTSCRTIASRALLILAVVTTPATLAAQVSGRGSNVVIGRPGVFLDCQHYRCDHDYLRTHIGFVDYLRDRAEAQVHVLLTTQSTAAGGRQFTLDFIGRRQFAGREDTLYYVALPGDTEDETRQGLAHVLELGLVPYAAHSGVADDLTIDFDGAAESEAELPVDDPWDHWVFRVRGNGSLDGEQTQNSVHLSTSVSANRITDVWKIDWHVGMDFRKERFELDDRTIESIRRSRSANGLVVKSIGGQWSAGVNASVSSSDRVNQRLAVTIAPAIEYDLFPYAESTRRQLTIMYRMGARYFAYQDTTIYEKLEETVARQSLAASLAQIQPWGTVSLSVLFSNDPAHPSISRQELSGNLRFRISEGLSLNLSGHGSRIHDQLYLPKEGASEEEVLLQQRQLATSFEYRGSVGLSYTFGSIFNSVVNPRFEENNDVID